MQYRTVGKDTKVSVLGFGCMRLPLAGDGKDQSAIDEHEAVRMIRHAIDYGVNYIDTAYPYHQGNSETVTGKALQDGYRSKVLLADKMPMWMVQERSDLDKYFNEQCEKLKTGYIDCYLLHAMNAGFWITAKKTGALEWLSEKKREGKIKHAGFSFHDGPKVFKEIIDGYNWDFCQIQLNYMDTEFQAGIEGMKYAASKGISIVVMEPLKGGKLAQEPCEEIQTVFNSAHIQRKPAEWALHWLWNMPEVSCVLSGMSTMQQTEENIKTAESAQAELFSENDHEIIAQVKNQYKKRMKVGCNECSYCMPCPQGVAIPQILSFYNNVFLYDSLDESKFVYEHFITSEANAAKCVGCGQCEPRCPQKIHIASALKEAHKLLGN